MTSTAGEKPSEVRRAERLPRRLQTADVVAVSTGAMFSSGFFLLPGVAAAATGYSVVLAYLAAGVLVIPAMLCQAELATAMPRAGGTYFYFDRALGQWAGMIGGVGSWAALVLKSAFALIGFGAYVAVFTSFPTTVTAVVGGVVFIAVNIGGAKESAGAQRALVGALVGILVLFVLGGLVTTSAADAPIVDRGQFLTNGWVGFGATIAMVSVSYAGLTKVASVAEEVQNPTRAIPLGMVLSLLISSVLYVGGTWVVVSLVPPEVLHGDLAPVATASGTALGRWMSNDFAQGGIAVAALAAFLSTANAGVMAAARYPMAMARDGHLPKVVAKLSSRGVPVIAVLVTGGVMLVCVVALDVEGLAKAASAFQLLLFAGTGAAVIVMREAHITTYQPGYRVPLYPLIPLLAIGASLTLIAMMGLHTLAFPAVIVVFVAILQTRRKIPMIGGAVRHWFRRLGSDANRAVERELGGILVERSEYDEGDPTATIESVTLEPGHPWIGLPLSKLGLKVGTLVVLIERGHDQLVPNGRSVLVVDDRVTLLKGLKTDPTTAVPAPPST